MCEPIIKLERYKLFIFLILNILLIHSPALLYASDIVLDIGHSKNVFGSISCSGKTEYEFNKVLVNDIRKHLIHKGKTVLLTTSHGSNKDLSARAAVANGHDVLISLHHDSVQWQFINHSRGESGRCSDKAAGFSIFISKKNVFYTQSILYAKRLGNELIKKGLRPNFHHAELIEGESRNLLFPDLGIYQYDNLRLLREAKAPAILLEAAVIVNPEDEKKSQNPEYRAIISESIYQMIDSSLKK